MSRAVIDVDTGSFETEVLERSRTVPVVVDFWAPWCGPCRTLGPVLEALAAEAAGRWILAKVNSDENPELSRELGIRGIPAVKAFVDGRLVDEFTGALPKSAVQEFLQRVVPGRTDVLAREATAAAEAGDEAGALALWNEILDEDPAHGLALVQRARHHLLHRDAAAARRDLETVTEESGVYAQAQSLLQFVSWSERVTAAGGAEAVRARAAAAPDSAAARFDLGCALAVAGSFADALECFLDVVRTDRRFEDDAGRVALLALFAFLGDAHDLTREYRAKLSSLLF